MKNVYHRLLLVIAGATQQELATYVRYLKTENRALRSKLPKRVLVTEQEHTKLMKFGSQIGLPFAKHKRLRGTFYSNAAARSFELFHSFR